MDLQAERPIENRVEVLNGGSFRDAILYPRLQPLLQAKTLSELTASIDPVANSLRLFTVGDPAFELRLTKNSENSENVLPITTVIDLTKTLPMRSLAVHTASTNADYAAVGAVYTQFNALGLADRFILEAGARHHPYLSGWGTATIQVPAPLGVSDLALSGFFFNEDRPWASYSLASHGVSARLANSHSEIGVSAVARHVHSITDSASDIVRALAGGDSLKVAAKLRLLLDEKSAFDAEIAGKPGDAHHIKAEAYTDREWRLTRSGSMVVNWHGRAGYLHGTSRTTATNILDRFTLGGPWRFLGSKVGGLGPTDGGDHVGAHAYWYSRFALHCSIHKTPLRLSVLSDIGAAQLNKPISTLGDNVRQLAKASPFVSVGAGITYNTGPAQLELLYAIPVQFSGGDILQQGVQLGIQLELQ